MGRPLMIRPFIGPRSPIILRLPSSGIILSQPRSDIALSLSKDERPAVDAIFRAAG